jgi:hypothetical protein
MKNHEKTGQVGKGKSNSINYVFLQVRNGSRKLRSEKRTKQRRFEGFS